MEIVATNPTVIPATAQVTYDHWWIVSITINAGDPANVFGQVTLRKCYFDGNGLPVLSPADPPMQFVVPQIMQDPDPNVQAAMNNLISAVITKATAANLL